MGLTRYYQVIPDPGRLLDRLRADGALSFLFAGLTPYGGGPFDLDSLDPGELEELVDGFADGRLGRSREEIDRALADLRAEIAAAVADHPDLETRATSVDALHGQFDEALAAELLRLGDEAAGRRVEVLLYGTEILDPGFFDGNEGPPVLIPAASVEEGAGLLEGIDLSEAGHGIDAYACDQFRRWKDLILEAAAMGEGILVGFS